MVGPRGGRRRGRREAAKITQKPLRKHTAQHNLDHGVVSSNKKTSAPLTYPLNPLDHIEISHVGLILRQVFLIPSVSAANPIPKDEKAAATSERKAVFFYGGQRFALEAGGRGVVGQQTGRRRWGRWWRQQNWEAVNTHP